MSPTTKPPPESPGADTEWAEPDAPPPTNVVEALARVMHDLPGIGKMTGEERRAASGDTRRQGDGDTGVNYAYRSIEQITAEAQNLFARYGVVFVPRVQPPPPAEPEVIALLSEITRNSTPQVADLAFQFLTKLVGGGQSLEREFTLGTRGTRWTDTYLTVTYRIYGPGGAEDFIDAGPFLAVGRDNSDKGFNKAMTQAYKQCLLQVLCVADPQDEGEHQRHLDEDRSEPPRSDNTDQGPPLPFWQTAGYADEDELVALTDSLKDMMTRVPKEEAESVGTAFDALGYPSGARLPVARKDVEQVKLILKAALAVGAAMTDEKPETEPAADGEQGTLAAEEATG